MSKEHQYSVTIKWTGNKGKGTVNYVDYERDHTISVINKPEIPGSSDPAFRGDKTRYNPEDMLVASLSSCHMLWYLHLCSAAGIIVTEYMDNASGIMVETESGGGKFKNVTLNPSITVVSIEMIEIAKELHHKANELCFIANSVNFPVYHNPIIKTLQSEN